MKLLMIIVLVAAYTYVGYGFSRHYILRLNFFSSLLQFFNKMNLDINFSREKLKPIVEKFESSSKELGQLLKNFVAAIEQKNLDEKKLFAGLKLPNDEERQLLFAFFKSVGHFDLSGQTHQLNNYIKQFEQKQLFAQEEKNKYAPLFTKLGLIIGVIISLVLI